MSLDYNVHACTDHAKSEAGRSVTDALIWNTIRIGVSTITKRNIDKVYERTAFADRALGTFLMNSDGSERPFTMEDLRERIGLKTNANNETDRQFAARTFLTFKRRYE